MAVHFSIIQQVMKTYNQQSANQYSIWRKPNKKAQDNHADSDCPDHLQDQDIIIRIIGPGKGNDQDFHEYQPATPFHQKYTQLLFCFFLTRQKSRNTRKKYKTGCKKMGDPPGK